MVIEYVRVLDSSIDKQHLNETISEFSVLTGSDFDIVYVLPNHYVFLKDNKLMKKNVLYSYHRKTSEIHKYYTFKVISFDNGDTLLKTTAPYGDEYLIELMTVDFGVVYEDVIDMRELLFNAPIAVQDNTVFAKKDKCLKVYNTKGTKVFDGLHSGITFFKGFRAVSLRSLENNKHAVFDTVKCEFLTDFVYDYDTLIEYVNDNKSRFECETTSGGMK